MTYRDDLDAAIARADAMEGEAEDAREDADEAREDADQARAERDEMAAKVHELESKLAGQRPRPERASTDDKPTPKTPPRMWLARGSVVVGIVVLLVVGWVVIGRQRAHRREANAAWQASGATRTAYMNRWRHLISVEPCMFDVAYDVMLVRQNAPDKVDPRATYVQHDLFDRLHANCLAGASDLIADPKLSAAARVPLRGWLAIQQQLEAPVKALADYYRHSDWREDDFANGPVLWKPVVALLERQDRAIADLRRITIPAIDRELREMQKLHDALHGHDAIWWRVELGLRLRAIVDRAYDAGGIFEGRPSDDDAAADAVRPQVVELLGKTKLAPIALRRILRKADHVTRPIADGATPGGETPFWHLAYLDHRLLGRFEMAGIPALPPDPGPRPYGRI